MIVRSMRHASAICFDLDDTLWPVAPVIAGAEQALFGWLAQRCPRVTLLHDVASMRIHRAALAAEHPSRRHDLAFLRRESLGRLLAEAGYQASLAEENMLRMKSMLSQAEDTDYTEAITKMNKDMLALEAAQSSFAKISQLNLFDYIK